MLDVLDGLLAADTKETTMRDLLRAPSQTAGRAGIRCQDRLMEQPVICSCSARVAIWASQISEIDVRTWGRDYRAAHVPRADRAAF
jgi:hypothetical protein